MNIPPLPDAHDSALQVACAYCKAKAGEGCWYLKDGNGPRHKLAARPHRSRVKASVVARLRECK